MDAGHPDAASGPSGKTRYSRVRRACTECQTRKIRCDGNQPCKPCSEFTRDCQYSSRKQKPAPERIKTLETKLRQAVDLIKKMQLDPQLPDVQEELDSIYEAEVDRRPLDMQRPSSPSGRETPEGLQSMIHGGGRLVPGDNDTFDHFGGPSGLVFLDRTKQIFHENSDHDHGDVLSKMTRIFDAPLPDAAVHSGSASILHLLPPTDIASKLIDVFFNKTYPLFYFLHERTFRTQAHRIYTLDSIGFSESDHRFMPQFYAVIALGYLFEPEIHREHGCAKGVSQALRHFTAARQMADISLCKDIVCLQTIVCFVLFLLSTARIATARGFIGLAVAASMRMGLHSQTAVQGMPELEKHTRSQLFWTIVKLDVLSKIILGLPGLVDTSYVDQSRPSGDIRDYTDADSGLEADGSTLRKLAASAQYMELLMIYAKIITQLYPRTEVEARQRQKTKRHIIKPAVIIELEKEFATWRSRLPDAMNAYGEHPTTSLIRVDYELEMAYNWGRIILYRPFLHYLARLGKATTPDLRQLRYAAACIKIARATINRSNQMLKQGLLSGAAWSSIYSIFLSIVVLVLFLATQHDVKEYGQVLWEIECGIRLLLATSCQDNGSKRCLDVLRILVSKLSTLTSLDIGSLSTETGSICLADVPQTGSELPGKHDQAGGLPVQTQPRLTSTSVTSGSAAPMSPGNDLNQNTSWNWNLPSTNQPFSQDFGAFAPTFQQSTSDIGIGNPFTEAGYNDHTIGQHSSQEMMSSEEHMEVAWAEAFEYPNNLAMQGSSLQSANSPIPTYHCGQPDVLTSEDIAAFMMINPEDINYSWIL